MTWQWIVRRLTYNNIFCFSCVPFINLTSFHGCFWSLLPKGLTLRLLLGLSDFTVWRVKCVIVLSLLRKQLRLSRCKWGNASYCLHPIIFLVATNITLGVYQNFPSYLTLHLYLHSEWYFFCRIPVAVRICNVCMPAVLWHITNPFMFHLGIAVDVYLMFFVGKSACYRWWSSTQDGHSHPDCDCTGY